VGGREAPQTRHAVRSRPFGGGRSGVVAALLAAAFLVHPLVATSPGGSRLLAHSKLAPYVTVVADLGNALAPDAVAKRYDQGIDSLRRIWRGEAAVPVEKVKKAISRRPSTTSRRSHDGAQDETVTDAVRTADLPDELVARLYDRTLTIVNVLPRKAWAAQRIRGSVSLPESEIASRRRERPSRPRRGHRRLLREPDVTCGARAVGLLHGLGYTRVRDFDGGLAEWTAAGLPWRAGRFCRLLQEREPVEVLIEKAECPLGVGVEPSIGALLSTWLGINLGCGVLYWLVSFLPGHGLREAWQPMGHDAAALLEAVYFSFVTGLSIGFGDIVPVGAVRVLAVVQGGACLLVFGAIISKFVSGRQEQLTEEIHRIAFEDRLGRVRTNLHLVVSEIQEISAKCGDGRTTPRRSKRASRAPPPSSRGSSAPSTIYCTAPRPRPMRTSWSRSWPIWTAACASSRSCFRAWPSRIATRRPSWPTSACSRGLRTKSAGSACRGSTHPTSRCGWTGSRRTPGDARGHTPRPCPGHGLT
jgi:rhodanese-related sulfurtransferase